MAGGLSFSLRFEASRRKAARLPIWLFSKKPLGRVHALPDGYLMRMIFSLRLSPAYSRRKK